MIDTATCTNKESELLDLDHLVSIHLLFPPSSQIKTVGRNCETKVVDFCDRVFKELSHTILIFILSRFFMKVYENGKIPCK